MTEVILWTLIILAAYYYGRSSAIAEQINKKQYRRQIRSIKKGHDIDINGTTSIMLKTNNE